MGKGRLELIAKVGGGEQDITARGREPGARLIRVPRKEEIHLRGERESVARPFRGLARHDAKVWARRA